MVTIKPRYSDQMESGVLYFVVRGKIHGERNSISGGIKPKPLTIITCATKNNKQTHIVILVIYLLIDVPDTAGSKANAIVI